MAPINPYDLATFGQNSENTFTLASNGILYDISITDITPPFPPGVSRVDGGVFGKQKTKKEEKGKLITVTALIKGKKYKESIIVENRPDLTLKDIKVDINDKISKPKINITLL